MGYLFSMDMIIIKSSTRRASSPAGEGHVSGIESLLGRLLKESLHFLTGSLMKPSSYTSKSVNSDLTTENKICMFTDQNSKKKSDLKFSRSLLFIKLEAKVLHCTLKFS